MYPTNLITVVLNIGFLVPTTHLVAEWNKISQRVDWFLA